MSDSKEHFYEQRYHPRFECDLPVEIITEDGVWDGTSVDISVGGIKIESHKLLNISQVVKLRFTDIEVSATVRWNINNLYGLRFNNLKSENIFRLIQLCDGRILFDSFGRSSEKSTLPLDNF